MDLITVIIIGVIVAATGAINPQTKDPEEVAKAPETQITTPEVKEPEPEPEPVKEPEPEVMLTATSEKTILSFIDDEELITILKFKGA